MNDFQKLSTCPCNYPNQLFSKKLAFWLTHSFTSCLRLGHHHRTYSVLHIPTRPLSSAFSATTIIIIDTVSVTFAVFVTWWGIKNIIVIEFRVCQDPAGWDDGEENEEREEHHPDTEEKLGLRWCSRQSLFMDSLQCVGFMCCYVEILIVFIGSYLVTPKIFCTIKKIPWKKWKGTRTQNWTYTLDLGCLLLL